MLVFSLHFLVVTRDHRSKSSFPVCTEIVKYLPPIEVGCLAMVTQGIWHNLYRGISIFGFERAARRMPVSFGEGAGLIFLVMLVLFGAAEKRVFKFAKISGGSHFRLHLSVTFVGGVLLLASLLIAALDNG